MRKFKIHHLDRYKKSSIKTYDKWKDYDKNIWLKIFKAKDWIKAIVTEIRNIEEAHILDVGCGTGRIIEDLIPFNPKRMCGMDISQGILEVAANKFKTSKVNVELKNGDGESQIPWEDSSFDYVLLAGVLHHLYRPFDALREIKRVLKSDGKIIIIDPSFPLIIRWAVNLFLWIVPVRGDYKFYSSQAIMKILDNAGFGNTSTRSISFRCFLVSGQK